VNCYVFRQLNCGREKNKHQPPIIAIAAQAARSREMSSQSDRMVLRRLPPRRLQAWSSTTDDIPIPILFDFTINIQLLVVARSLSTFFIFRS
jgi:hypothetical protein